MRPHSLLVQPLSCPKNPDDGHACHDLIASPRNWRSEGLAAQIGASGRHFLTTQLTSPAGNGKDDADYANS